MQINDSGYIYSEKEISTTNSLFRRVFFLDN